MAYTSKVAWETMGTGRIINSTTFNGTFQPFTPLAFPAYKIKMVNNSNVLVTVSVDGVNAVDVCPGNSFWLYDETISLSPGIQGLPAGTTIFINGAAGGGNSGSVYLVSQYLKPI